MPVLQSDAAFKTPVAAAVDANGGPAERPSEIFAPA